MIDADTKIDKLLQKNVTLADKNWFASGGAARWYVEPKNQEEFVQAIQAAITHQWPVHMLGLGANTLMSDAGFDGLVIRPVDKSISYIQDSKNTEQLLITAAAGLTVDELIECAHAHNGIGLEDFACIPGTLGGAVFMNIHYFKSFFGDYIDAATVIDKRTGKLQKVAVEWFNFGYDTSRLHDGDYYLYDVTLRCQKVTDLEVSYQQGRVLEIIRHRRSRYPYQYTCGSFFRNFLPHELKNATIEKPVPFIAYYLDLLGIKGQLRVNHAVVSYQHANMLVNEGGKSSSADIILLARTMQQMVYDKFGLMPVSECCLVGFSEYPLLKV
jgi:UDP-N-acetylmuramate dehydrogenase